MAKKKKLRPIDYFVEIPIDKLVQAQWNYKKTDDARSLELMEKLKKNLARNEQLENLIVRDAPVKGFYEVVNGNHRLMAMGDIGIDTIVCRTLGKITLAHAERIAFETNETKFEADPLKLAEMLSHIANEYSIEDLAETTALSQDELKHYTQLLEFDWSNFDASNEGEGSGEGEGSKSSSDEEFETIELRLPQSIANLFTAQLDRFKIAIYPDTKNIDEISVVQPIEAMSAHLGQIPDKELV